MANTQLLAGMADIQVAKGAALFTCLGLGSCIGFAAWDPKAKIGGIVHIMLPEAFKDRLVEKPGKFATTGIPALVSEMVRNGAGERRLVCAYAGGAQVFKFGNGTEGRLDVGARNSKKVADIVAEMRLNVIAKEVGGTNGRTMIMDTETGNIRIRTVNGAEKVLCNVNK
ncbi:MAG: chemotaxis protein CheD [Fimbriimonadaceae bacterium]